MKFTTVIKGKEYQSTFYSIGGGFVVKEALINAKENIEIQKSFPYPIQKASELHNYCNSEHKTISEIVLQNELSLRTQDDIDYEFSRIWETMLECMNLGCHTEGVLPGGLNVRRRAFDMHQNLKSELVYTNKEEWIKTIRKTKVQFRQIFKL